MTPHPAWLLIGVGLLLAAIGVFWLMLPLAPWLGRLPGDVVVEKDNFRLYFPIVTSIVISIVLTGILWLVRGLSR